MNRDTDPAWRGHPRGPLATIVAGVVGAGALLIMGGAFTFFTAFGVGGLDSGGLDPVAAVRGLLLVGLRFCLPVVLVLAAVLWWVRVRRPLVATGLLTLIPMLCTVVSVVQESRFPFAPEPLWWTVFGCLFIGGAALTALLYGRGPGSGLGFAAALAVLPLLVWPVAIRGWHTYVHTEHVEATTADLARYRDDLDGSGPGFVVLDAPGWQARHATVFPGPDRHSILIYEGADDRRVMLVQGTDPMNGSGAEDPLWEGCDAPDAECFEYPVPAGLGEGTAVLWIPGPELPGEADRIRMSVDGVVVTLAQPEDWESPEPRTGPFPDAAAEELVELMDRLRPAEAADARALAEADTRTLAEIY